MLSIKNLLRIQLTLIIAFMFISPSNAEEVKKEQGFEFKKPTPQLISNVDNGYRANISPPVKAGEPILFVDLNCHACQSLLKEIQEKGEHLDLRLALVAAIPPKDTSFNNFLWHFSDSRLFGKNEKGCSKDCSTVKTAFKAPSLWNALEGDNEETLKRLILMGHNIKTLNLLNRRQGTKTRVPALLTDSLHVIESYDQLNELLSGSGSHDEH